MWLAAVYGKRSFLSKESDTKIVQSIYFAYNLGMISSYSNGLRLLAYSEQDHQHTLDRFSAACDLARMKISFRKTEVL